MVYDHPSLPLPLKREAERWLFDHKSEEWKKGETESQFLYKTRKYAIGPFKEQFWNLPEGTREAIRDTLEKRFAFLFEKLAYPRHACRRRQVRPPRGCPAHRRAGGRARRRRLRARRSGGRLN
jgi:hypothetical protein